MEESLDRLLDNCTVYVQVPNGHGTGFFVAPGLVLTCDHVIEKARPEVSHIAIRYKGQSYPVREIVQFFEKPYDLALLRVEEFPHPCVLLGQAVEPFTPLYAFGYTQEHPQGESMTLELEGRIFDKDNHTFLKLKEGQVQRGASGSPVLNWQTGKVCGMIKFTRANDSDLGGGAIPTETIFANLPFLREANAAFHRTDTRWAKARSQQPIAANTTRAANAILYTKAGKISRPKQLFGRTHLLAEANSLLEEANQVLLCGFTGLGKTALAATIVDAYLREDKGPVVWLDARYAPAPVLFETLAESLDAKQAVSGSLSLTETGLAIHDVLHDKNIRLVVIDDARDSIALFEFLKAIPKDIPVLATSQHRFLLDNILDVDELSAHEALSALGYYAGHKDFSQNQDAKLLCKQLGFHTYALEIAGDIMKVDDIGPAELRRRMAPHELEKPEGMASPGRAGLRELLEYGLNALDQASRETFMAFGAFFTPGLTAQLLSAYIGHEPKQTEENLVKLTRRSLAKRRADSDYYSLPDIAFSYARAKFKEERHDAQRIVKAVKAYLTSHAQDYERLGLDMPNLLGAASLAKKDDLVQVMSMIAIGGYPTPKGRSYLDERGHNLEILERLEQAIEAARQLGGELNTTLHYLLSKRGNAYYDRGDLVNSLSTFQAALELAPSANRQAKALCAITKVLVEQGDESGYHHLDRAYRVAKDNHDDDALSFVLEYRTHLAIQKKDHKAAHQFALETVEINKRLGNPIGLAFSLLNLGAAEFNLSHFDNALAIHQEALVMAQKEGYMQLISDVLHSLAEDYHTLAQYEQAQKCFDEALVFCRQSGDMHHEGQILLLMQETGYTESEPPENYSSI